jgi:hypothetical protein
VAAQDAITPFFFVALRGFLDTIYLKREGCCNPRRGNYDSTDAVEKCIATGDIRNCCCKYRHFDL